MNKTVLVLGLTLALCFFVAVAQEVKYESKVINIEIPVRVFDGERFVDNLSIKDFEIFDNGQAQHLEAVYLVRKTNIERREETQKFSPSTKRHFYLIFEMSDFDHKLERALDFFVREVLIPGDELVVVTPLKSYRLKGALVIAPERERIIRDMVGLLRRDILLGNSEYRDVINNLVLLAQSLQSSITVRDPVTASVFPRTELFSSPDSMYLHGTGSFEEKLQRYSEYLSRLENLRSVDSDKLTAFAEFLKSQSGQKDVFLFYQREFIPKIDPRAMNILMSIYNERPDVIQTLSGIFDFYKRSSPLNVDFIKKAYANASAAIHFLFISRPAEKIPGISMEEESDDIYAPFKEMSFATGGMSVMSGNVEHSIKTAVAASENYYLLYYTPKNYLADGSFHRIEVKLKTKGYRVSHRAGYIAD